MKTVLHLPFPPSVNGLYNGGHNTPRRFKSARCKAWEQEAGYALLTQKRPTYTEPVEVTYQFTPPDKKRRDVFNFEKPVSDLLVAHGILADDSLIHRGVVEWASHDVGVVVIIEPLDISST